MHTLSRTFSAVALALGTLTVAGLAHAAVDTPPTTPATLSANRYSTTGADVIWARSTDREGLVRGYEVFRDGVPLGIRDALSVSEKALVPGKSYTYSVAAVDSAGQRSAPIRITLGTKGFTNAASAPGIVPPTVPVPVKPPTNPAPVSPVAGAPAAPTGLSSSAYSGTSGEIAWARPVVGGLRYDVRRDGTTVASAVDRLSYVDRALSAGREYRYEVVAIDAAGRRSAPATVTLRAKGTAVGGANPFAPVAPTTPTSPVAPAPVAPVAGGPSAPTGLRTATYSSSSGELFWARPSVAGLRYDVSRDGVLVKGNLDGLSYYDSKLVAGKSHRYDVVAIDASGRRSATASVTLQPKGGTSTPATPVPAASLTVDNAESVLVQVFDTLGGEGTQEGIEYGFGGNAIGRLVPDAIDLDSYRQYDRIAKGNLPCAYGGTGAFELGSSDTGSSDKLVFDKCAADEASSISGAIDTSVTIRRGDYIYSTGRNFRISRPNAGVFFDGSASTRADAIGTRISDMTGTLTFDTKNGTYGVRDATMNRVCGEGSIYRADGVSEFGTTLRTSGTFTYLPPVVPGVARNPEVAVRTSADFLYQRVYDYDNPDTAPATFETGRMTVTAKDGSRLDVEAGNGDRATYRLTVTANGKSAVVTKSIEPLMKAFSDGRYCNR